MMVLENVYVEQMIVNGLLHFCIFKTNSIFLKIHVSDLHLCPEVLMFRICRKKYPSCQTSPVSTGVLSKCRSALSCLEYINVRNFVEG